MVTFDDVAKRRITDSIKTRILLDLISKVDEMREIVWREWYKKSDARL